jgi:choline dehydrogenase-like flavoprotein
MIVDSSILSSHQPAHDIIVAGGGVAGLTLAYAAARTGLRVLVVEAGGIRESRKRRHAFAGEIAPPGYHPPLDLYRVHALGGTSRIWGGRCIPYDRIDFAPREWIPLSGWPIPYEDISAFYPAALRIAEAGEFDFDPSTALSGSHHELVPGLDGPLVRTTLERFSRPTDFWRRLGPDLIQSRNVDVLSETALARVRLCSNGKAVRHIEVIDKSGARQAVRARCFVLALGGLETTRVLLAETDVHPAGIGNAFDQLGRCYMSHLCTTAATITFSGAPQGIAHDYERDRDAIYVRRRLWLTERAQRDFRLSNTTFRTHLPEPADPDHRDAILSAMFLTKSLVRREYAAKFSESPATLRRCLRHAGNIARDPARLAAFGRRWLRDRVFSDRKLPSVVLSSSTNSYILEFHCEQVPNPESRVTLIPERDRNGLPRLRVDWRVTSQDIESLQRAHAVLAGEVARRGVGRLCFEPDIVEMRARRHGIVGGHHLGTTRMAADPRHGVVDTNCRVHGVANLYIASGSVVPTSSQANPTLTVVALALRLADHLSAQLRAGFAGAA